MNALNDRFGSFARVITMCASSPSATVLAFVIVAVWGLSGSRLHYSAVWQLVMTTISAVVTFLMVFVLNNAQSRDTAAINAKLDSLIFAIENADNRLIGLEQRPHSEAKATVEEMRVAVDEAQAAVADVKEAIEDSRE